MRLKKFAANVAEKVLKRKQKAGDEVQDSGKRRQKNVRTGKFL
jgi:hypothetical protein